MSDTNFSNAAFQVHLNDHKLMGARCQDCGALYLPPRPMCTACYSASMTWTEIPGGGELAAYTTVHIAPTAMIEAGYGRDNPYCSGIVKLDAGPSISAQIVGVDVDHPESIKIGTPVTVEFLDRGEGDERKAFLAFRPV